MTYSFGLFDALLFLILILAVFIYIYARSNQRARIAENLNNELVRKVNSNYASSSFNRVSGGLAERFRKLGASIPLFSDAQRREASSKLICAGYRSNKALFTLVSFTLLSIGLTFLLTLWLGNKYFEIDGLGKWLLVLLVAVYIGSLIPRLVLDQMVARRQKAIQLSLPDALDLMVICANSGLSLNASIERVADELFISAPELADEFKYTATELKLSSDVERVLEGLAKRTQLDGMRTLVNTFIQARVYGTSVTKALRILAKSERTARMMKLEENAAKLAVKITIPMMLFILPTVIMVGAAPAFINASKAFGTM